jgi:protein-L-isoaspartate O-methyltransferase
MKFTALLVLLAAGLSGQTPAADKDKLAPYFPTPPSVVQRMLQLAELKKGEKMFDIGSGDGRIVIMAAKKFGADGTGVELDQSLCRYSVAEIKRQKLEDKARIICADAAKQDYSSADVVTIYLLPEFNAKLRPILEKQLKKGARVVAHDFDFQGWKPDKVESIEDDGEGRSHTIFVYHR